MIPLLNLDIQNLVEVLLYEEKKMRAQLSDRKESLFNSALDQGYQGAYYYLGIACETDCLVEANRKG